MVIGWLLWLVNSSLEHFCLQHFPIISYITKIDHPDHQGFELFDMMYIVAIQEVWFSVHFLQSVTYFYLSLFGEYMHLSGCLDLIVMVTYAYNVSQVFLGAAKPYFLYIIIYIFYYSMRALNHMTSPKWTCAMYMLKLPSLFAAWLFWTFHNKSHNIKALVILI